MPTRHCTPHTRTRTRVVHGTRPRKEARRMCPGWQRCTEEGTQVQEWPKARGGQHFLHKTRTEVRNRSLAPATPATPPKVGICFHFMLLRPQSSARKHAKPSQVHFPPLAVCCRGARQGGSSQIRNGKELNQHDHAAGRQSPPHPPPVGPRMRRGAIALTSCRK
jgi:hypothetical protein